MSSSTVTEEVSSSDAAVALGEEGREENVILGELRKLLCDTLKGGIEKAGPVTGRVPGVGENGDGGDCTPRGLPVLAADVGGAGAGVVDKPGLGGLTGVDA